MKYEFIHQHRSSYGVAKMCRALHGSRSGYYRWKQCPMSNRTRNNNRLVFEIRSAYEQSRKNYGSPRITAELKAQGIACSKNRIARLMRYHFIRAKTKRRFKITTHSKHSLPIAKDLLHRNFNVPAPNTAWVSDITYIRTEEGWLYLAVVMDIYSRMIVGWAMNDSLHREIVMQAFEQAVWRRSPAPGLIFHSDHGIQYASHEFQALLHKYKARPSMSRQGNCYDNACAESLFHTLKTELIHHEHYFTRNEAKNSIFDYIEVFYNRQRRHSVLNYKSPVDFEGRSEYSKVA